MPNELLEPITVCDIPVIPFESITQVVDCIINDDAEVTSGVAIAINPEKILKSLEQKKVKDVLLEATFPYADGIGVVKALQKKSGRKLARIPGCQLWLAILAKAAKKQKRVFLVGGGKQVIEQTANKLVTEFQTNLVGQQEGYFVDEALLFDYIKCSKADIVIVALGSPKQELFIKKCQNLHANAFYMGVGGSFDVYVGNVKRAPDFWINLNLEWLYRLISEPKRIFRQLRLFKFVYLYLFNKI